MEMSSCSCCNSYCNIAADCWQQTRTSLRTATDYLWEKAAQARPAWQRVPRLVRSYCCCCCDDRQRKSIDVAEPSGKGSATLGQRFNNNNFVCDALKCAESESATVFILPPLTGDELINKSSQTNGLNNSTTATTTNTQPAPVESKGATPTSLKSATYSDKSTASAQSSSSGKRPNTVKSMEPLAAGDVEASGTPITTLVGTLKEASDAMAANNESTPTKWTTGVDVLHIDEELADEAAILAVEEEEGSEVLVTEEEELQLNRNASLVSLQSKSESIKTQLGDTPTVLSRTQSAKSLVIEESLEGANGSFVVVQEEEDLEQQLVEETTANTADLLLESLSPQDVEQAEQLEQQSSPKSRPQSRARSPSIAELKLLSRRNSMIKSMDSLYEPALAKAQDLLDSTTESNSSSSQLNGTLATVPKPQHTPLKQKSKTLHFLKSHRRVSPVKQSIKMAQPELYPPTLQRFDKPREGLLKTFDQLDDSNWEIIMLGLKSMVRLLRYHADYLENQMHMVCIQLTRSVRNLRSQVARAACQASAELFSLKSKCLEQECDDLVCALLHRTADTNRFLRADATRALESMSDNLSAPKILTILTTKGALHQNALVRTTTAKLLNRLVERLGNEKVYAMAREHRDKFFITGANLLLEGSLETRCYAKSLFRQLSAHPSYQRLLLEVIPTRTYRNVEKTLKSIH